MGVLWRKGLDLRRLNWVFGLGLRCNRVEPTREGCDDGHLWLFSERYSNHARKLVPICFSTHCSSFSSEVEDLVVRRYPLLLSHGRITPLLLTKPLIFLTGIYTSYLVQKGCVAPSKVLIR
jgi:hypothetical protein